MNTYYKCRLCGEDFNRIEMVTFEPDGTRSPPLADPICPHCGEVYRRPPPVLREVPLPGSASPGDSDQANVWIDTSRPAVFASTSSKDRVPLFIPGETVWLTAADEEPPKPPESDEARLARWADFRAGLGLAPMAGVEDTPERQRIREIARVITALPRPRGFGSWRYVAPSRWRAESVPAASSITITLGGVTEIGPIFVAYFMAPGDAPSGQDSEMFAAGDPRFAVALLYSALVSKEMSVDLIEDSNRDHAAQFIRLAAETLDGGPIRVKAAWKMPVPPEPGLVPWVSTASEEAVELFWAPASYPHPGDLEGAPTDPYEWYTEEVGRSGSAVADRLEIAWPFATEFCEDVTHFKALGFRLHS